jgi:hypothetical protein
MKIRIKPGKQVPYSLSLHCVALFFDYSGGSGDANDSHNPASLLQQTFVFIGESNWKMSVEEETTTTTIKKK